MDQHFIIEMKTKILQCNVIQKFLPGQRGRGHFYLVMYMTNYYVPKHSYKLQT